MKIYYTRGFEEEKENPLYQLEIAKFRLGNLGDFNAEDDQYSTINKKDLQQLNITYIQDNGISLAPSKLGITYKDYYDLEVIQDASYLTLSMEIPGNNVSMINSISPYNTIFVYYKNEVTNKDDIAFVLFDIERISNEYLRINPLYLETNRNIIKIPRPSHKCTINYGKSMDTEFLEGCGVGSPSSIYENINEKKQWERYVSVVSYESYLLEKRSEDEYHHLDTTFINKFGLKEY